MDRIATLTTRHERLPLREPFETSKRRAEASDTVFVTVVTEDGLAGVGAATPVQYVTGETVESVISAVENLASLVVGRPVKDASLIAHEMASALPQAPSARAGVEIALVDLLGKSGGAASYVALGGKPTAIETDITIPVVPPEHAAELAAAAAGIGFRLFKVKVGTGDTEGDAARVAAITQAVPGCRMVVDANQGFLPEAALAFVHGIMEDGAEVAVFEQPVDKVDIQGLAYVTRSAGVPVFADEAVCTPQDARIMVEAHAVAGINVKLMKCGFFGALEIAGICRSAGIGLMLGCMLEPRVGLAAAIHLACISGGFSHFDLDADLLLSGDSTGGFIRDGAMLRPIKRPGLGFRSDDS
jgi:L-alanine-DL-glutamate epimerase-like enolase superfamily enzyme